MRRGRQVVMLIVAFGLAALGSTWVSTSPCTLYKKVVGGAWWWHLYWPLGPRSTAVWPAWILSPGLSALVGGWWNDAATGVVRKKHPRLLGGILACRAGVGHLLVLHLRGWGGRRVAVLAWSALQLGAPGPGRAGQGPPPARPEPTTRA